MKEDDTLADDIINAIATALEGIAEADIKEQVVNQAIDWAVELALDGSVCPVVDGKALRPKTTWSALRPFLKQYVRLGHGKKEDEA
eukprot:10578356-Alexandrium_andersonii.AAC.1